MIILNSVNNLENKGLELLIRVRIYSNFLENQCFAKLWILRYITFSFYTDQKKALLLGGTRLLIGYSQQAWSADFTMYTDSIKVISSPIKPEYRLENAKQSKRSKPSFLY